MVTLTVDNVGDMQQHGVEVGCLIEDIQDTSGEDDFPEDNKYYLGRHLLGLSHEFSL